MSSNPVNAEEITALVLRIEAIKRKISFHRREMANLSAERRALEDEFARVVAKISDLINESFPPHSSNNRT